MKSLNDLTDAAFRQETRRFLEAEYPQSMRFPSRRLHWHEVKDWYLKLAKRGWTAPGWPTEYGGMGLSPAKQLIYIEEQERWGVARAPDQGVVMVGPLLIQYGSESQRRHYLPKILSWEHIWCQGYSEPNAGSDLADLRTRAELNGDEFVVNGQKIWTTLAQDATHIYLLVRTDPQAKKKQEGISFLLVDLQTPGITIRPIRNIAGHEEFCEVFFENVRVPRDCLLGEMNQGWTMAKALLGFERLNIGSPKMAQYALGRLAVLAEGRGLLEDPAFVDRFTQLRFDVADLGAAYEGFAEQVRRGQALGADISWLKIWGTETLERITALAIEAAGGEGGIPEPLAAGPESVDVLSLYYNALATTIYGGTNEIQRNILAKQVLRLPQ